MDIRNINPGSNLSPDRLRSDAPEEIDHVEKAAPVEDHRDDAPSSKHEDRVEISDAGQQAHAERVPEDVMQLRMARRALDALPPMSSERAEEIRNRVRAGHYSQPEQIRHTARNIVSELFGQPPAAPDQE